MYKETVKNKTISRLQYISDIISEIEHEWITEKKIQVIIREQKTWIRKTTTASIETLYSL